MITALTKLTNRQLVCSRWPTARASAVVKFLVVLAINLVGSPAVCAQLPRQPIVLQWNSLIDLPNSVGLGGPFAGTHGGALLVAGGANFPNGPPWGAKPGTKSWYDQILVLAEPNGTWRDAGSLPRRMAYGASVSTEEGVVLIGGDEQGKPLADVYLVKWNAEQTNVSIDVLPSLPEPTSYVAAGGIGGTIYVIASHHGPTAGRMTRKAFWALRVAGRGENAAWRELPPWPGPARHKAVAATQSNAEGNTCLYLFSGEIPSLTPTGEPDLANFQYLDDAYCYDPNAQQWTQLADLPATEAHHRRSDSAVAARGRPVAAAEAIGVGSRYIFVFSGVSGSHITEPLNLCPPVPRDVLCYDTHRDEWRELTQPMPVGVVTTNAVSWGGGIVIPSGETRPAVRTPRVQRVVIQFADDAPASSDDNRAPPKDTERGGVAPLKSDTSFGWLNWTVLLGYLATMLAIGVYCARHERSTEQFFLAGRRIPWWAAGLSIFGTQLSAITFMAIPATAYTENWVRAIGAVTVMAVLPLVIWFYLPFFRRVTAATAYEYLEQRFNVTIRVVASVTWILFQLGRMGIVLYLPAIALSTATGIDIFVSIVLMGLLATAYTALGGIEAVIWTDVIQVIVLLGGAMLCIGVVIVRIGGVEPLLETFTATDKFAVVLPGWDPSQMVLWVMLVGTFFANLVPYTSDQAVVQRYLTTPDDRQAAQSLWANVALAIPTVLLFYGLGTALYVFYQSQEGIATPSDPDQIVPWFVVRELAPGCAGLVIAAIFAAAMSSLDSAMNSVATAITTDLYRRFRTGVSDLHCLRLARGLTVVLGCAGTAIAVAMASADIRLLFDYFNRLLGLFGGALAGLFFLGVFTRRTHSVGALVGAASGFAATVAVAFETDINFFLYAAVGTCTCATVGYLTSLIFACPTKNLAGLTIHTLQRQSVKQHYGQKPEYCD